jgi:hypothetical protein
VGCRRMVAEFGKVIREPWSGRFAAPRRGSAARTLMTARSLHAMGCQVLQSWLKPHPAIRSRDSTDIAELLMRS